jgi:hypothetical protein
LLGEQDASEEPLRAVRYKETITDDVVKRRSRKYE